MVEQCDSFSNDILISLWKYFWENIYKSIHINSDLSLSVRVCWIELLREKMKKSNVLPSFSCKWRNNFSTISCFDLAADEIGFFLYKRTFFFVCFLFTATPAALGSSPARGGIEAVAASLHHSHGNARSGATSAAYATACGNPRSLTHWSRPGIKPISSWD